jgi:hypothetical protein
MKTYDPHPEDVSGIRLPAAIQEVTEDIARQVHETWAQIRINEGWQYGPLRDDRLKETPCLVPYDELPEEEKLFDRETTVTVIKYLLSQGFEIRKPGNDIQ